MELEVGKINQKQFYKSTDKWETVTIQQLSENVRTVPWKDYIEACLKNNVQLKVTKHTQVAIPGSIDGDKWKIVKEMAELIRKTDKIDQANLLVWRMLIMFSNNFMDTKQDGRDVQQSVFAQLTEVSTRDDLCITQIKTFFPGIYDDMLIARFIDYGTKVSVEHMFDDLKDEFRHVIEESDWLSRSTKSKAVEKLLDMKLLIGELVPNTPEFQELKSRMSTKSYLDNILAIGNFKWQTLIKSLGKEKQVTKGYEDERNAYYYLTSNTVRVKTGMVTKGIFGIGFNLAFPTSLVYGSFVSVLAHELIHGFDSKGRDYDKNGLPYHWWEPEDDVTFTNKAIDLVSGYVYLLSCSN